MPAPFVSQIGRVTTGLLNTVNDTLVAQSSNTGTGQSRYNGQLGQRIALGPDEVKYDSSVGTLYGGVYQYVRFKSGDATVPAVGLLCFWDLAVNEDLYQVTTVEPTGTSRVAGVILNAVTGGNYGWIQVAGKATVKCIATLTAAGAVGQSVFTGAAGVGTDNAKVDTIAAATAITPLTLARFIGIAETAPSNGGLCIVRLKGNDWHI